LCSVITILVTQQTALQLGLAFLFRLIAAQVTELTPSFDEAVLPMRVFLNGLRLGRQASIVRPASSAALGAPLLRTRGAESSAMSARSTRRQIASGRPIEATEHN
jgi:hypothetical protein